MGSRTRKRAWQAAVTVVCLLAGLLLGTAHAFSGGQDIRPRNVELSSLIRDAEGKVSDAATTAQGLQDQIDAAAGSDLSPQVADARTAAAGLESAVGLTAVTGPGLTVTLNDAPRDSDGNYPAGVNPDDLVVHQQDVQSVVNALWAGGAEGMMIMDQRVIEMSAVRCIGNTLLLGGRTYSPPFVITAIGPADRMVAAMNLEPGIQLFQEYVTKLNLGFDIDITDSVTMPAYSGLIHMTVAEVPR